jgi:hypothetical protein
MEKDRYWVPWRSRHTNEVHVEGPYSCEQVKRERKSLMDQLGWDAAEVGTWIIADSKAEALEKARKLVGLD